MIPHLWPNNHLDCKAHLTKGAGFTLIELLVSSTIIIILATLAIANFRSPYRYSDITRVADEVISVIRGVQASSAAGEKQPAGTTPDGGYGIRAQTCSGAGPACVLQTFADLNANGQLEPGEAVRSRAYGGDMYLSAVQDCVATPQAPAALSLAFHPTSTQAFINGSPVAPNSCVKLVLRNGRTNQELTITINLLTGLVSKIGP